MFPAALEALEHLGDSLERIITPGSTDYAGRSKALPYEKALPYVRKAYTNLIGAKSRQEALRAMQHLSSYLDGICDGWYQRIVTLINAVNIDDTNAMASQSKEDHTMTTIKTQIQALARLQAIATTFYVYHKVKGDRAGGPDYDLLKTFTDKAKADKFASDYNDQKGYKAGKGMHSAVVRTTKIKEESSARLQAIATPKGESAYDWFIYKGKSLPLKSGAGTKLTLGPGEKFGVRKSADGKKIRMISPELGPNKVFTLTLDLANKLAKQSKPAKNAGKKPAEDVLEHDTEEDNLAEIYKIVDQNAPKILKAAYSKAKALGPTEACADFLASIAKVLNAVEKNKKFYKGTEEVLKFVEQVAKLVEKARGPKAKLGKDAKMNSLGMLTFKNAFKGELSAENAIGWISDEEEDFGLGMAAMVIGDAADHIRLASAFLENNIKKVDRYSSMDTSSREQIPDKAWDYIQVKKVDRYSSMDTSSLEQIPDKVWDYIQDEAQ
jgi:hypothetical protein